jgi:hypothetical protein
MKTYWGSGGIAPSILWPRNYMEVSGQVHAPAALPPEKEPLDTRLGGPRAVHHQKMVYYDLACDILDYLWLRSWYFL